MTIAAFEKIYDKKDKTEADIQIIFDVLTECGQNAAYIYLLREFYRKQQLLYAAIANGEDLKKKTQQFERAASNLNSYHAKNTGEKESTFSEWICAIEFNIGFAIDRKRDIKDFVAFVKMLEKKAQLDKKKAAE